MNLLDLKIIELCDIQDTIKVDLKIFFLKLVSDINAEISLSILLYKCSYLYFYQFIFDADIIVERIFQCQANSFCWRLSELANVAKTARNLEQLSKCKVINKLSHQCCESLMLQHISVSVLFCNILHLHNSAWRTRY